MKRILMILAGICLLYSCSANHDGYLVVEEVSKSRSDIGKYDVEFSISRNKGFSVSGVLRTDSLYHVGDTLR